MKQDNDLDFTYIQDLKGFDGAAVWLERGVIYERDDGNDTAHGFPERYQAGSESHIETRGRRSLRQTGCQRIGLGTYKDVSEAGKELLNGHIKIRRDWAL